MADRHLMLYTDGGARRNPGPGAVAALVLDAEGNELAREAGFIGNTTNNRAEYRAVLLGLDLCSTLTSGSVVSHTDSELVAKQLQRKYRVKDPHLARLHAQVEALASHFDDVKFKHLPRTNALIAKVDRMVNETLDREARRKR